MTKRNLFIYAAAGLILILALLSLPREVGSARGEWYLQTVPSRTATPEGGPPDPINTPQSEPPTAPPPTDDPDGPPPTSPPQPGPTNTLAPGEPSPTPTTAATVVLITPEGGYIATAQPCGTPPTVQARGLVNVREGPGLDYEPISSLVYLEVRPIIGRAEFATWWLIELPDDETGWVANQAVAVQGYTGAVPIVDPPELNDVTPTPGPTWEPTPNPECTPMPTTTATVELGPAEPEEATAVPTLTATPEPTATTEETEQPTPTESPSPEPEAAVTTAATPTTAASPDTQEPPPENNGDSAASASSWILFIGIGLVVIGAVSFFLRNR